MKSVIFCDFWGVPKEILGDGCVENVLIPPFLERVNLVPVDSGEKITVATMVNKGLNPDFYNLLLKKDSALR